MPFFHHSACANFVSETKNVGVYYNRKFPWDSPFRALSSSIKQSLYVSRQFFKPNTNRTDVKLCFKIIMTVIYSRMRFALDLFFNQTPFMIENNTINS